MLLGLCVLGAAVLGALVVLAVTRPADDTSRRRDRTRRRRELRRHPDRVNLLDVENRLLADAVPEETVRRVMQRADRRRMAARTMWRWLDRHGSERLVLTIDADLGEDAIRDHLRGGTSPDWTSLSLFAGLNNDDVTRGMPLAELVDLDSVSALEELTYCDELEDWTTTIEPEGVRGEEGPRLPSSGSLPSWPDEVWGAGGDDAAA